MPLSESSKSKLSAILAHMHAASAHANSMPMSAETSEPEHKLNDPKNEADQKSGALHSIAVFMGLAPQAEVLKDKKAGKARDLSGVDTGETNVR